MNLIINGFYNNPSLNKVFAEVANQLQPKKCIVFTDRAKECKNLLKSVDTDIYNHDQMISASYPSVNWTKIKPLDAEIILQMTECESNVLKMMDRLTAEPLTYDQRKTIYLKHLRYWNHLLDNKSINLSLYSNIPHEVYDYIIYCLCKAKNIPTLMTIQSSIDGIIFIAKDWEEPARDVLKAYQELSKMECEFIQLSDVSNNHYIRQISKTDDPIPWYMNTMSNKPLVIKELSHKLKSDFRQTLLKAFNVFKVMRSTIRVVNYLKETKEVFEFYDVNAVEPDLKQRYIYVALHYQPECTTSPMAGVFVDQILIVQLIASSLPDNIYIYVKEHPCQTLQGRTLDFYKELTSISQVRLVPRQFNSFRLIENCLAVATATGTVGWESLFRQKPVLMFGRHFYQYAPNVFTINRLEDCQQALHKIIEYGVNYDLNQIKLFVKAIETVGIFGYADIEYANTAEISDKKNTNNLLSALLEKIKSLGVCDQDLI